MGRIQGGARSRPPGCDPNAGGRELAGSRSGNSQLSET